jgi:CubicO group peptidase (beta-lactamase class C family)
MELTYCCFNAITRDYARLGSMLLHHGKVNNAPLIDSSFIAQATKGNLDPVYGQALWIGATGKVAWYALQGTLGQYIAVVPAADLVIVRTGNKQKKSVKGRIPDCLQTYVDETIKQFAPELL